MIAQPNFARLDYANSSKAVVMDGNGEIKGATLMMTKTAILPRYFMKGFDALVDQMKRDGSYQKLIEELQQRAGKGS